MSCTGALEEELSSSGHRTAVEKNFPTRQNTAPAVSICAETNKRQKEGKIPLSIVSVRYGEEVNKMPGWVDLPWSMKDYGRVAERKERKGSVLG